MAPIERIGAGGVRRVGERALRRVYP